MGGVLKGAPITRNQLRALWASARDKGLEEEALRDIVKDETGARSISRMTTEQAAAVLKRLGVAPIARKDGRGAGGEGHKRFDDLGRRPGMATPKQLRKIEAMVADRFRAEDKGAALRQWLKDRFGVADLRFLPRYRASDVIVALEKMEVLRAA